MPRFHHETENDKAALIKRALISKPTHVDAHATHQGWAVKHKNGTLELLVSFANLDKLLASSTESTRATPEVTQDVVVPVPIEKPVDVIEPAVESVIEDAEDNIESVDAPKKRGRPKAVVA